MTSPWIFPHHQTREMLDAHDQMEVFFNEEIPMGRRWYFLPDKRIKAAPPVALKLEVGKRYVCKNWPAVKFVEIMHQDQARHCFRGLYHFKNGKTLQQEWLADGQSVGLFNGDDDLIAKYVEPVEEASLPVPAAEVPALPSDSQFTEKRDAWFESKEGRELSNFWSKYE